MIKFLFCLYSSTNHLPLDCVIYKCNLISNADLNHLRQVSKFYIKLALFLCFLESVIELSNKDPPCSFLLFKKERSE